MSYELDIDYGLKNEILNIDKIQKFFDENIIKLDYYNEFDFTNSDGSILIELKSRRCSIFDYNDTMISVSKINKSKKIIKNKAKKIEIYYFFYYSNNDLYYWKYDDTTNLRIDNCNYRGELKKNAYIPISLLRKIN